MNRPNPQLVATAEQLRAVYDSGSPIAPIKDSIASVEEAYAVQEINTNHWLDGGRTDTHNLISLCPRHHKMHHQGLLGISGDADRVGGVTFTDAEGRVITERGEPVTTTGPPPTPTKAYRCPLNGRFDWTWLGGWEHPNATTQRIAAIEAARTARNAAA